jgi:hypothetical protein
MTPSSEIQLEEPKTLAISTNETSGDEADVFFSIKSASGDIITQIARGMANLHHQKSVS